MRLYSICDNVANEYGPIFEAKNDDVAKRNFKQILDKTPLSPADFELWFFADFNHDTGEFYSDGRFVCVGEELFVQPELDSEGDDK